MRIPTKFLIVLILLVFFGCRESVETASPKNEIAISTAEKDVPKEESLLEKAKRIHDEAITLDTHVDIPGTRYATPEFDPGVDNPDLRCDLVKMKKGGMDGVFLAAFTSQRPEYDKETYDEIFTDVMAKIDAIHRVFELYPDRAAWAQTAADMVQIEKSGKRAIAIGVENGYPVGDNLANLKKFHERGVRYITLSHGRHNQICDSSHPKEAKHNGLSDFGEQVVAEMNRIGIMVDVSHISVKSFFDVMEVAKAPVIASHSGCYVLNDHDRNLTDDQLRALTKNGGVIQIVALGGFLKKRPAEYEAKMDAIRKEVGIPGWWEIDQMSKADREKIRPQIDLYRKRRAELDKTISYVDIQDYINHIDHAVKIAGINHVGIGTDFDGGAGIPGFNNHAEALNVTVELVKRGYSEEDIKKIWGGNLLRVWRDVENVAKRQ